MLVAMEDLLPDDPGTIGEFRLAARIGLGGMGVVYLAYTPSDVPVAIKVVRPELSAQPEFRQRFVREVSAIEAVRGTFTAQLVRADPDAMPQWLATEYVPGPTLAHYVQTNGPLPSDQVRLLAVALLNALESIHGAGIVHRDLKPSNVILADGGPRVIDFGIARALEGSNLTTTGQLVGSLGWMAPEQLSGAVGESTKTDVHAWAAVVYFAATGVNPFGEGRPEAVAWRISHGTTSLAGLPETLRDLRPVLESALDPQPDVRPSVVELRRALGWEGETDRDVTRVVDDGWTVSTPTVQLPEVPRRRTHRRRLVMFALSLAALGFALASGAWLLESRQRPPVTAVPDATAASTTSPSVSPTSTEASVSSSPSPTPTSRPLVPIAPTGSFALSSKGVQATLVSRRTNATNGVTTVQGIVTEADAVEYCTRDPGGSYPDSASGLRRCVDEVMAVENGEVYKARAQCAQELLRPALPEMAARQYIDGVHDSQYWWRLAVQPGEDDWLTGDGQMQGPAWQNVTTGETRDSTGAGGGFVWYDLFTVACQS